MWKRALVGSMRVFGRAAATWTAAQVGIGSGYVVTDPSRKVLSKNRRPMDATANELLAGSLTQLRSYSRNATRNNPTARAAVDGLRALIVGSGIALEIDTDDATADKILRKEWQEWVASCGTDGRDLYQLQNNGAGEVIEAGELLWRMVIVPERIKQGLIPLAVLPLEAEWLDETVAGMLGVNQDGSMQVGPIRLNKLGNPIDYRIRNPEMSMMFAAETVQAKDIVHVFEKRRSMQARGEPWMAPIIEVMQQERDLVDAELAAAVTCSSLGIAITSQNHDPLDTTEDGDADDPAASLRLGGVARLFPGEQITAFSHNRPGQQIAQFRQMLRGDIAGAMRLPQRFLDRDVSRANYSSMRADMIDTERMLAPVREWFGQATAGRLLKEVMPFLCAKAGIAMPKKWTYRLLPDGQPYVDPTKDVAASKDAIAGGLSTHEAEVAKKGGDYKLVWAQLAKEKAEAKALGLDFADEALVQAQYAPKGEPAKEEEEPEDDSEDEEDDDMKRSDFLAGMRSIAEGMRPAVAAPTPVHVINETRMDEKTAEIMGRAIGLNTRQAEVPQTVVNVPAPIVNVAATQVRNEIAAPIIPAPIVNVAAPTVNVAAPNVVVENSVNVPQRGMKATPNRDGSVTLTPEG